MESGAAMNSMIRISDMTIKIQQCDRDRAAQCEESLHALYGPDAAKKVSDITRSGGRDGSIWVQEFAKHRIEAMTLAAEIADGNRTDDGRAWDAAAETIAEQIRNAAHKGGKDE